MAKLILSNKTELDLLFNCWSISESSLNICIESHDESIEEIKNIFKDNHHFILIQGDDEQFSLNGYTKLSQITLIMDGHLKQLPDGSQELIDMWNVTFDKVYE